MKITLTTLTLSALLLTGCGTLTGIPSHGGGKRFAVEQELVAASSRAAVKEMDLSALKGRKVAFTSPLWATKVRQHPPADATPSTH